MAPLLEVDDIHTFYGNIEALKGISLKVEEGEIVTLIGSNGAGKSTTLRSISGLNPPRTGKITFQGQEISAMAPWDRLKNNGGDRVGFINGWLYQGRFTDSGLGDVRVASKIGLTDRAAASRLALLLMADLPTGEDKSGISTGVAVAADNTWAALKGRDALQVKWNPGPNRNFDSDELLHQNRK